MTVNCFVSNYYFNIFLILAADVEAKLIDDLLSQYSRYVRPVAMESQLVEIFYHMKLSRILKIVSVVNMTLLIYVSKMCNIEQSSV